MEIAVFTLFTIWRHRPQGLVCADIAPSADPLSSPYAAVALVCGVIASLLFLLWRIRRRRRQSRDVDAVEQPGTEPQDR